MLVVGQPAEKKLQRLQKEGQKKYQIRFGDFLSQALALQPWTAESWTEEIRKN